MVEPRPRPNASLSRERERVVVARAYHYLGVDEVGISERDGGKLVSAVSDMISIARFLEVVQVTHIRLVCHRLVIGLSGEVHQKPNIGRVISSRKNGC